VTRAHSALLALVIGLGLLMLVGSRKAESPPPAQDIADITPRGYVCYRASSPPKIDGKLDDPAWAAVPWSERFRDIEGDLRPEPPLATRVKMLWDDEALYVAAELEEPHVWATLREHDVPIFHDNDFEVFIDPDGDGHLYGEFEMNAFNTTWDLLLSKPYKDGGHPIDAWEITGLKTGVAVQGTINNPGDRDTGWTLEVALPWRSLKEISKCEVPPRHGDQWRINFSRVEWDMEISSGRYLKVPKRPEHNWVWSPQGVIDMHRPERWGILQFSTAAASTTPLVPDPSQAARDYLHRVYYSQAAYFKDHGGYVTNLAELGVPFPSSRGLHLPRLETTTHQFEASVEQTLPDGRSERWRIDHEARFRRE
jgi:hypothetical protein